MITESTIVPCMMVTMSGEIFWICRMPAEVSRKAHSRAPNAMPTGWLRPSSAIAMPVKPSPVGKSRL